jgi:teichuronic acid biosynthesis glycosyltransferase TuaG
MNNLLISVCIPAYNASALITETLESIKMQTYSNWELIVVEDGSDDGTEHIVNQLRIIISQNVVYYRNSINKGLPATRNVAVSKAKGDWLAFVDSDDIWAPNHLQSLIETVQKNRNCDFIHSGYNYFTKDFNKPFYQQKITTEALKNFPISLYKREYNIQPSSIMVSQKLYAVINGFDESYLSVEDLNFYFRCCEKGFKFAYSGKNTCNYRKNPNGMTSNALKMSLYAAKAYEDTSNWHDIPEKLKHTKIAGHWLATARLARKSDPILAKKAIVTSVKNEVSFLSLLVLIRIYLTIPTRH